MTKCEEVRTLHLHVHYVRVVSVVSAVSVSNGCCVDGIRMSAYSAAVMYFCLLFNNSTLLLCNEILEL